MKSQRRIASMERFVLALVILVIALLAACAGTEDIDDESVSTTRVAAGKATPSGAVKSSDSEVPTENEEEAGDAENLAGEDALAAWLQQLKAGEIADVKMDRELDWARGYFLYYSSLDSIRALAVDQIIYHALEAHRRLDTGEFTEETITRNARNLLTITEGIQYNSSAPLTDQVGQTGDAREAILEHVVESQVNLSPAEALASDNITGIIAPPAAGAIGGKYLVYTQETPDSEFVFLGVVLAADAAGGGHGPSYNAQGWDHLVWLGDASGPFWDDLPTGSSGDPASTSEARPGVLLISEDIYLEIIGGER